MRAVYPFSAVVGQDEAKLALILNVIEPYLGGAYSLIPKRASRTSRISSSQGRRERSGLSPDSICVQ